MKRDPAFDKFMVQLEGEVIQHNIEVAASTVPQQFMNDRSYAAGHFNGYLKGYQDALAYIHDFMDKDEGNDKTN